MDANDAWRSLLWFNSDKLLSADTGGRYTNQLEMAFLGRVERARLLTIPLRAPSRGIKHISSYSRISKPTDPVGSRYVPS